VCLADITIDNPNLWFALGYAIAAQREAVFICSEEYQTKFQFDIEHRKITTNATGLRRAFIELRQDDGASEGNSAIQLRTRGGVKNIAKAGNRGAPRQVAALVL
jgi:hypothetical protein